ncbi:hypothetical protein BUE80_DR000620 [Diplocarpon rosae]|nr:hypothetical protein BUE80_DR000620 [Diplocarpon rosae]
MIFLLLSNEAAVMLRQTLTPLLYLNSQIVKIALFVITLLSVEVFGLAWKCRDVNNTNAMLGGIVGLTLLASPGWRGLRVAGWLTRCVERSIPFTLSLILAWKIQRSRASGIAIVVTGVDEEQGEVTPLLPEYAYRERRPLLPDRSHTT